jgi:hypothetical protein
MFVGMGPITGFRSGSFWFWILGTPFTSLRVDDFDIGGIAGTRSGGIERLASICVAFSRFREGHCRANGAAALAHLVAWRLDQKKSAPTG